MTIGGFEKGFATRRDLPKTNGKKIQGLESQVALNAKTTDHLATLLKDHHSNCLSMTSMNGKGQLRVNDMEGKLSRQHRWQKQPQAKLNDITEERDILAVRCEKLALKRQCMSDLTEEARSLRALYRS